MRAPLLGYWCCCLFVLFSCSTRTCVSGVRLPYVHLSTTFRGGGGSSVLDEVLQEEDFYKVLGTTKAKVLAAKDPDKEIQRAYRKRAVHTHPDKTGGDRKAFDKVAEAYEGLQDAEKRRVYDRFGKEGAKQYQQQGQQGPGMAGAEELFRRFFGGAFGAQQQQRGPSVYMYDVSLEALYHGLTRSVQLPDGRTVSVTVPPGAQDGQILPHDDDVAFRLRAVPHRHFVRKGYDLAVEIRITLAESLTGVQRKIRHLNGDTLLVVSAADDESCPTVIRSGDVHVLKGYGMPKDGSTEYGDLYVQYEVVSPSRTTPLTREERKELQRLLQKLEGSKTSSTIAEWPFSDKKKTKKKMLKRSSPSNFGAGYRRQQQDPFADAFNPFGNGFFFSSTP